MRALLSWVSDVQGLYASLDGKPIRNLRDYFATTPVFEYGYPELGSVWGDHYTFGDSPKGCVSNGYWLMLYPLRTGTHVLTFGVDWMHVTYILTVEPPAG